MESHKMNHRVGTGAYFRWKQRLVDFGKGMLVTFMGMAVYGLPKSLRHYIIRRWGKRVFRIR